jgi:hypothetical protein
MTLPIGMYAQGALYALRRRSESCVIETISSKSNVSMSLLSVPGWAEVILHSACPLLNEDVNPHQEPFIYHFLHRQGKEGRFLLVSKDEALNDYLLSDTELPIYRRSVDVDIPLLVRTLIGSPTVYVLAAVNARVEGYGQALKTMLLYGKDIGDATLFRNLLKIAAATHLL